MNIILKLLNKSQVVVVTLLICMAFVGLVGILKVVIDNEYPSIYSVLKFIASGVIILAIFTIFPNKIFHSKTEWKINKYLDRLFSKKITTIIVCLFLTAVLSYPLIIEIIEKENILAVAITIVRLISVSVIPIMIYLLYHNERMKSANESTKEYWNNYWLTLNKHC